MNSRYHNMLMNDYNDSYLFINKNDKWQFLKPKKLRGWTVNDIIDKEGKDVLYDIFDQILEVDNGYKTRYTIKEIIKEINDFR